MPARLHVQFAAPPALYDDLPARFTARLNSAGKVAARDLTRYYALIRQELAALDLTATEAFTIALACRLWPRTPEKHRPSLRDAIETFLDDPLAGMYARQNGVAAITKAEAFVLRVKVRQLKAGGTVAVTDAIERYWQLETENDTDTLSAQLLADTGLILSPAPSHE